MVIDHCNYKTDNAAAVEAHGARITVKAEPYFARSANGCTDRDQLARLGKQQVLKARFPISKMLIVSYHSRFITNRNS